MRTEIYKNQHHNPKINYRGANASRIDNLTDAVFGIAITLLIFNLTNPNSFTDLITFTQTLPAFLISISFIVLVWSEHLRFSEIYSLNDTRLVILNTFFIALIIFYVYPLRFLTLLLTGIIFPDSINLNITTEQFPILMMYYGFAAFALYFVLFLFYQRAYTIKKRLNLNPFELFYTKAQRTKLAIMYLVPLLSITLIAFFKNDSISLASFLGGMTYCIYPIAIIIWQKNYSKKARAFDKDQMVP